MYISKETVKNMLKNFHEIEDKSARERVSSSVRNRDGISYRRLDMIRLEEAIKDLPVKYRNVVIMRWVRDLPIKEVCDELGFSRSKYYTLSRKAILLIQKDLNAGFYHVEAKTFAKTDG